MRSEPSDARSDGLKVRSTLLHSTIPDSNFKHTSRVHNYDKIYKHKAVAHFASLQPRLKSQVKGDNRE
ncbi:hypothetical protein RHMOL_Rhmol05G0323100 [Rhododendron molle]|nr:hypothetical protein RHMOL_Rhmol05G0323100 [Rhododendron molle]